MSATAKSRAELLAAAIARGESIVAWCKRSGVSEATGYRIASRAGFEERVDELRRRLIDRAVGKLARTSARAVQALERIIDGKSKASDMARIAAARALLAHLVDLQAHAELATRFAELEKRVEVLAPQKGATT